MKKFAAFLSFLLVISVSWVNAQRKPARASRTCGTSVIQQKMLQQFPDLQKHQKQINTNVQAFQAKRRAARLTQPVTQIPVVFHVIYRTATENISDAQIQSQLAVLNQDYRRRNPDSVNTLPAFKNRAADTGIQFCLAITDPAGNPTTGITRTQTSKTDFTLNDEMKFSKLGGKDAWPADKYLNIWVCDLANDVLGYAQFPGSPADVDGVVLFYKAVGKFPANPNQDYIYNQGRTATHEIGHYLGLEHIWGPQDSSCDDSDGISDTPDQEDSNGGCPQGTVTSCTNASQGGDMYQNFMDYTDDACMNLFTKEQGNYMYSIVNVARPGLLTSAVCKFPLRADFSAVDSVVLTNIPVQFNDNSIGLRATSWEWIFEGGTPSNATIQNPIVQYTKPGLYSVTLTVKARNLSDTKTKIKYIRVTHGEPFVYPNPAQGMVNVDIPANYDVPIVYLVNALGQVVRTGVPQGSAIQFDVTRLANGIYFAKMPLPGGGVISKKIIVLN